MSDQPANAEAAGKVVDGSERAAVDRLLRLAGSVRLFRSSDGRLFARVSVQNRSEVYGLRSNAFREWLISEHFHSCQTIPPGGAIRRALGALEAFARFGGGSPSAFIRVGGDSKDNGAPYYIDLGDASGQAIEIGAGGWNVVATPGVDFRRPGGLLPLPLPSREGSIELLRPYVNLDESEFRLLVAWMATALRPAGPYPVLALYGEQGSAKSTLARTIRLLIDPQDAPLLSEPGSTRDMMVTAVNGWLLAYDNIGVIPAWLSDGLCLLSTGGGFAGRAMFSNDERVVINAQRPVILNGIEEFVRRADLSDRSVFFNLAPIHPDRRRREDEFWGAFREDQPRILGGLLDAIVGGLRELPSVELEELPRMADFAVFGEAIGRGLGWEAWTVLKDYSVNIEGATATQLDQSVLATAMLEGVPATLNWCGTASALLTELGDLVGKKVTSSAGWPKSPSRMTNELRRISPQLRSRGLMVHFGRNRLQRVITIRRMGAY